MTARPTSLETFLSRLCGRFDDERLRTDVEALARVAGDESGLPPGSPGAVIYPVSTEEVALIVREASALGVGLVPRGGGTGKAGACIPGAGEVVVDLSRMNRLLELRPHDQYAIVQPGLINIELDRAAREVGFMYPPDPASFESCTLGGNIATNAGGARAVKYGVTQRYVWGLEVVLPTGEVTRTGRRSLKGVAGFDVTSLLVGSEGTLGIITEALLHMVPSPPAVETAWLTFADPKVASRAVERVFALGLVPRMLELLDRTAIEAVRGKTSLVIPPGAGAALLVETDGDAEQALSDLTRACELALDAGATDSAIAKNEKEREAMRRTRRLVSSALKEQFPLKLSDDVAVPRSRMAELLDRAQESGARSGLAVCAYGHLGDGNLHINLLCRTAEERQRGAAVRRENLRLVTGLGGTITGEHGIGLAKRDELPLEQGPELIALQRRLKQAFDPRGIMNPGKVLAPAGG